jgi:acetyl/propionyl-CoA carboxylase alpha subunit
VEAVKLQIKLADEEPKDVVLVRSRDGATLWVDDRSFRATMRSLGRAREVALDDRVERVWVVVEHDYVYVHALGRSWQLEVIDPVELALKATDQSDTVTAPMPGAVQEVAVGPGDEVKEGQPLVVIESMKMQSQIVAWRDGVVERIHLEVGETFDRGAALVTLVAEAQVEEAVA